METQGNETQLKHLTEDFVAMFEFYTFRCKSPVTFGNMISAYKKLRKHMNAEAQGKDTES